METIDQKPIMKFPKELMDMLLTHGAVQYNNGEVFDLFLPMLFEVVDKEKNLFKVHFSEESLTKDQKNFYKQCSIVKHKEETNH